MGSLFDFRVWETEFRGRKVTMEVRPLKSREIIDFIPLISAISKKSGKDGSVQEKDMRVVFDSPDEFKLLLAAQEKAAAVLPNAVRNLSGIDDTWATICEEMYYLPFVVSLLVRLVSLSSLTEEDAKN